MAKRKVSRSFRRSRQDAYREILGEKPPVRKTLVDAYAIKPVKS